MFPLAVKKAVVLIVEDEAMIRMLAADFIEEAGFEVLEAASADEAIVLLESRLDVRLVFTDIDMPGSMDGMKMAATIRGRWPPIELIVTSGRTFVANNDLPLRGVFIPKPYRPGVVVAAIKRLAA